MKVLMANKYFFIKGGAENSFFETAGLLEKNNHDVCFFSMQHERNRDSPYAKYFVSNVDYDRKGPASQLKAAGRLLYSFEAKAKLDRLIKDQRPDIAHLNNIYHQISPSILHTLKKHNIPVVMTLRDYKLVCGSYAMVANGKVCEACAGGKYIECFKKACLKNSRSKSALTTLEMYLHHTLLNIYRHVDVCISPSRFLKNKVAEMGFKGRVEHLFNFTTLTEKHTPSYGAQSRTIVYFGRLSHEKGLNTLVSAVKELPDIELKIIGEGPLMPELKGRLQRDNIVNVELCGYRTGDELTDMIKQAMFIVLPSEWYENNPRTAIEAFALGKPAVGARIGGIPELVRDGRTGYCFESGNKDDLKEKINRLASDSDGIETMGRNARKLVETELGKDTHYTRLMEIYASVRQ